MYDRLIGNAQIAGRLALRDIPRHFYDGTEGPNVLVSYCSRYRLEDLNCLSLVVSSGRGSLQYFKYCSNNNDDLIGSSSVRMIRLLDKHAKDNNSNNLYNMLDFVSD